MLQDIVFQLVKWRVDAGHPAVAECAVTGIDNDFGDRYRWDLLY
ncbi:MAG: hypothetical protein CM1200mP28_15020 [Deltaproteobacteria bacterium]|nr:MAG: hypothetical protein CM1200mP28_15020 [Deltaproteobacteria bacterium]